MKNNRDNSTRILALTLLGAFVLGMTFIILTAMGIL